MAQLAIAYDLALVRTVYQESGYLTEGGAFVEACLLGIETRENVPGALISHIYRFAAENGWQGSGVVPTRSGRKR